MSTNSKKSALEIKSLNKVFPNDFVALKEINLDVKEGDFFALLGPNGAGKSTTIGIISSLITKTSGLVKVFENDIDEDFVSAKKCIGVVPQEFNFNQFEKVINIMITQAGYYGLPRDIAYQRAEKYLRQLNLWDKRNIVSRSLSGGMKRRLMIARALVHEPKLLILDEPTAGVDIELRRSMWDFLKKVNEGGTTIILTTHYLEEAENLCRNIAIIDSGEIIENTSMRSLLSKLTREVLVLDLDESISQDISIDGFVCRWIDSFSIEIEVKKGQPLNGLFDKLSAIGLTVNSLRNKSNRLEEMFVSLLKNKKITPNHTDKSTRV